MKELSELIVEMLRLLDFRAAADKLKHTIDVARSEAELADGVKKGVEEFVGFLRDKHSPRTITFGDTTQQTLYKSYVLMYRGAIDELDGVPLIVINDFPIGLKAKDNPVLNMILRYNTIEERDADLELLRSLLR